MIKRIELGWCGSVDFAKPTRDPAVEVTTAGEVRLVKRVVIADEMGDTTGRDVQPVGGLIWAMKELQLESADVSAARLAVWASCSRPDGVLVIELNGHRLERGPDPAPAAGPAPGEREHPYWRYAWQPIEVPCDWLRAGSNTLVMHTEDGSTWELLIETSRWPNRSAVSWDGGQTWDWEHLGYNQRYDGEFLVRLELERYPDSGQMTSEVFDLAVAASDDALGQPVTVRRMWLDTQGDTPPGTQLSGEFRAGPSPTYDPATWSAWQRAEGLQEAGCSFRPGDRFAQWRITLSTSHPQVSPVLRSVRVMAKVECDGDAMPEWGILRAADNPVLVYPSEPFGYLLPSRRTRMLRERWHLDQVVADATDDWERIVRLAYWTRDQWTDGWNRHWKQLHICPPWDAPTILELTRHNLSLGMCTHYSTVFVHVCAALGIPARHVIHHSHCTAEAWSDRWGKWVWLDFSGDMNDNTRGVFWMLRDGVPQSALEVRSAWQEDRLGGLSLAGRHADKVFQVDKRAALLDQFCIVQRNDQMNSLHPGELEHGAVSYQYDGYLWWRDAPGTPGKAQGVPAQFSQTSSRIGDFYWTENRTRIYLQRTRKAGVVQVLLESCMAAMAGYYLRRLGLELAAGSYGSLEIGQAGGGRLQVRIDEGDWQDCGAELEWRLLKGGNHLAARSVNTFGVVGPMSTVTLELL